MNIVGKNVVLRAIERNDLAILHRWSNDPDIQEGLGGWHFPLSTASLEAWIDSFRHDGPEQRFVIELLSSEPIGLVTLTSINWKDRNAFHGILIGEPSHRRKGLAADVVVAVMRYVFEELGFQRLDTTVVEFNTASLKLHIEKCGWKQDGVREMAVFRKNKYWSNILLGVTREVYVANLRAGKFDQYRTSLPTKTANS